MKQLTDDKGELNAGGEMTCNKSSVAVEMCVSSADSINSKRVTEIPKWLNK